MRQALAAIVLVALTTPVFAQMTPAGLWRSFDEKTNEAKSEVRIADNGGVFFGRIEKVLRKNAEPNAKCGECKDELKDQPIVGLQIIKGAKKAEDKDVWEDGKILDPENGKFYTLRLTPIEGGKKLEVRGSIGPFGRTQTWQRVE
ncbi:DUF2147 domain-containing protein [Acidovorax sp. HDW3]|uniref:DUF2147 domain-containing protein n=1 Tax=Acidovorax sp. HDW3 TaxID=2714923 RepID=UPI00140C5165|nr:DUF2147 domain-containing protein [Acidovorax sp. HDW3]QIL44859.1 DUF2147 domain-containing protein [Acidovorax sp. HDW3]